MSTKLAPLSKFHAMPLHSLRVLHKPTVVLIPINLPTQPFLQPSSIKRRLTRGSSSVRSESSKRISHQQHFATHMAVRRRNDVSDSLNERLFRLADCFGVLRWQRVFGVCFLLLPDFWLHFTDWECDFVSLSLGIGHEFFELMGAIFVVAVPDEVE